MEGGQIMRSGHKYLFLIFAAVVCLSLASTSEATFYAVKSLYVDGNFVGSTTTSLGLIYSYDRVTLASEGRKWNMYNSLNGALDEFAIYPGVLDANAVWDHYHAALAGEPNYTGEVASDNPLIYLRFEDATTGNGDTAANSGGSAGKDGAYINSVSQVTGIFGGADKAASFAGDPNGGVDIEDFDRDFALDQVSIEVWVKSGNLDDDFPRLFQYNGRYQNKLAWGAMTDANDSGIMQVGVIGGGETNFFNVQAYDINDNNWHQIVVTYDSTFEPNGYPNQVSVDDPLVWFRFEVDDIASNVPVTNSGSKAVDANYIGPHPFFAPGKVGKGVFLHGSGTEAGEAICIFADNYSPGIGDYSHSYAITPGDMTVELWLRTRPDDEYAAGYNFAYARMFSNNGGWTYMEGPRAHYTPGAYSIVAGSQESDDRDCPYFYFEDPSYDAGDPDPNATGFGAGGWHHLVYIFDCNDADPCSPPLNLQIYLDGALLGEVEVAPGLQPNMTGVLGPEFRQFIIGSENATGGLYNCLRGTIDEFAIYGYILPEERIAEHYKEGWEAASWIPETCAQIYQYGWNKPADKNSDCYVNFLDIVAMGNEWMRCNEPSDGNCEKPWLD